MRCKKTYDEACALAADYLAGKVQGTCTAAQALHALTVAGGDCYADGAAGAFLEDRIAQRDPLVEALLLHAGVVLEGDSPRRRPPAPFTVGDAARPVTPRERALVQDVRVQHLLVAGIDPFTQRPVCWAIELNRTLELHARAAHAGCRRRAFIALLRARQHAFLDLLRRATGVIA